MFIKRHLWAICFSLCLIAFTTYLILDTFVIKRVYTVVTQPAVITTETTEATTNITSDNDNTTTNNTAANDTNTSSGRHKPSHSHRQSKTNNDTGSNAPNATNNQTSNSTTNTTGNSSDTTSNNTDTDNSANSNQSSAASSDTVYSDDNISVTLTEYQENDTTIYVADVTVASMNYLKTAFAENSYGKNITEKTSSIAENANAILAINGDFYGAQEDGYVIRNGVLYRDTAADDREDLVIYQDGSFAIINENDTTASELLDAGAWQVLSFGPALVTNGTVAVSESEEVGKAMASNPRTALGITEDGHYLFVVSDGRTSESEGLSLYELAEFMQSLGVTTAYNLDGGGSSTMYLNGAVINQPTTSGNSIKERSVSDIVYIGY